MTTARSFSDLVGHVLQDNTQEISDIDLAELFEHHRKLGKRAKTAKTKQTHIKVLDAISRVLARRAAEAKALREQEDAILAKPLTGHQLLAAFVVMGINHYVRQQVRQSLLR